jgi:outer membrane protein insertion porin family
VRRLIVLALLSGCATHASHPVVPRCGDGWSSLTVTHAPEAHVTIEAKSTTPIEHVSIAGVDANLADHLRHELATKPGMTTSDAPIGDDIRRLWKLGVVSDVAVEQHGGDLVFVLAPRPVIHNVVRKGGDALAQARFRQLEATTFEPSRVQRMAEALRESYLREGRLDARVEARHRTHATGVDVCVELDPGPRVTIGKVEFPGRKALPKKTLIAAMQSKKLNHVGGTYDEDLLQMDVLYISALYWDRGFADVHVHEAKLERRGKQLELSIPIDEGPIYHLGKITVDLPVRLPIKRGDLFSRTKIADARDLIEKFDPRLYSVLPMTHIDKEARTIDIEFQLEWRWSWDALRAWLSLAH